MPPNIITQLRSLALFAGAEERTLELLALSARTVTVAKGEMLFTQSDRAETVYLVRRGIVRVLLPTLDGRELVIGEMRPGDFFGELSILTDQPRSTSALAGANCELIVLAGAAFQAALDAEPRLMRRVLVDVAQRLRHSTERESALAFLDAPGRLARILMQLDRQSGGVGFMTISQEDLAQRTGLTRQTVAKVLGQWRRAGWLITGRGKVVLLDRASLRRSSGQLSTP